MSGTANALSRCPTPIYLGQWDSLYPAESLGSLLAKNWDCPAGQNPSTEGSDK